jgi:hypothetical protein
MKTERDKMLAGELYDALNPELVQQRDQAHDLCQILNATREADRELRRELLLKIFGKGGDTVWLQSPFFCDFGSNIELGERVYLNFYPRTVKRSCCDNDDPHICNKTTKRGSVFAYQGIIAPAELNEKGGLGNVA